MRSNVNWAVFMTGVLFGLAIPGLPLMATNKLFIGKAVEVNGRKPLALIVGVDRYRDKRIPELKGAVRDAENYHHLLTGPRGYGFPEENVVVLTNEAATVDGFRRAFKKALVKRAGPDDPVVIIFSGHGSQFVDLNDDEEDGYDETLIFHDTNLSGANMLVDDEFNLMLNKLYKKTTDITVILDACNSETGTRSLNQRFVPPLENPAHKTRAGKRGVGDGADGFAQTDRYRPGAMPETVLLASARDGHFAYDTPQGGRFSLALLKILRRLGDKPLTYEGLQQQLRLQDPHAMNYPQFKGNLRKPVFGVTSRKQPQCWEVVEVSGEGEEQRIHLKGLPLPGMGSRASLRVYSPHTQGQDWQNPSLAKGLIQVVGVEGYTAVARWENQPGDDLKKGDLARLVRPGKDVVTLRVAMRPQGEPGGLSREDQANISQALREDKEAQLSVALVDPKITPLPEADLEVVHEGQRFKLVDRHNRVRASFKEGRYIGTNIVDTCWRLARIKTLLAMSGEGGGKYQNQETVNIEIVGVNQESGVKELIIKDGRHTRTLTAYRPWRVKITSNAAETIYAAGFVMTGTGKIFGLPQNGVETPLEPGTSHVFPRKFRSKPEPGLNDHILIFASSQPINWKLLGETTRTRTQARGSETLVPLFQELHHYLSPTLRGQSTVSPPQPWTTTILTLKTE